MDPTTLADFTPPSDSIGPVGAVTNAARILGHLGAAPGPLRLTQISRPLGINTSTCLNILRTLVAEGLVRHDAATKTYRLGRRIVELARDALNREDNLGSLRQAMDVLARKHGITIMLWGRLDAESLILLAASVGEPLRSIHAEIGIRVPLLMGSMGRLFAAELDAIGLKRRFDALAWQQPLDFHAYLRQVAEAAERGWALDAGHQHTGLWGVSAPISHPGTRLDRVVSAVLFTDQQETASIERIAQDLLMLARE
jgi:DNA-binding IclR family transcriptional regulator